MNKYRVHATKTIEYTAVVYANTTEQAELLVSQKLAEDAEVVSSDLTFSCVVQVNDNTTKGLDSYVAIR